MGLMGRRSFSSADATFEVRFSREAWETMLAEASRDRDDSAPMRETGGILIGSWKEKNGRTVVTVRRSSGPGPKSIRETHVFSPDLEYFRDRSGYYATRKNWRYLGEWHRHPGSFHALSGTDLRMASELLRDEKWPFLLLPLVNIEDGKLVVTMAIAVSSESGRAEIVSLGRITAGTPYSHKGGRDRMKVFVDRDWIERFAQGQENVCEYKGFRNPGESWVFLPLPGTGNATLRLIREGTETSLPDTENVVTAVMSTDGDAVCYTVREGEILEIPLVAVAPQEDVYSRNSGILETRELAGKKVLLVGCGSVGSTMAMELVRAGIGSIVLVDPDVLEAANICRHQAGLQHLGRRKADVVRDLLLSINPSANVEVHAVDVCGDMETMELMSDIAAGCDVLLCTTDTDESRIFVNDLSISCGVPSIQAGLHERAASGIVQTVRPGGSACFMCHRERVLRGTRPEGGAYAYSEAEANVIVSPGLSAQINTVSEIAVLRALDILCGRDGGGNPDGNAAENSDLVLISMRPHTDGENERLALRFSATHFTLEPSEKCPACGEATFLEETQEVAEQAAE